MYYPFLRGKLYELLSLRELSDAGELDHIIPIIEPVQDNYSALNKATEKLEENNCEHIMIYKPNVGELTNPDGFNSLVEEIYRDEYQIPGFILDNNNDREIPQLIETIEYDEIALIHYEKIESIDPFLGQRDNTSVRNLLHLDRLGPFIHRNFGGFNNVMLRDPFTSERRNADYKQVEYQSFSDDHIFYNQEGYVGYSDYSIVGEEYSSSGFAPYAIAMHITFFDEDQTCWVQHFVSESNIDQSNIAGKYMEAMRNFYEWVQENRENLYFTSALNELIELYNDEHYPGLGYLKKLQIKHHLELINNYFARQ